MTSLFAAFAKTIDWKELFQRNQLSQTLSVWFQFCKILVNNFIDIDFLQSLLYTFWVNDTLTEMWCYMVIFKNPSNCLARKLPRILPVSFNRLIQFLKVQATVLKLFLRWFVIQIRAFILIYIRLADCLINQK